MIIFEKNDLAFYISIYKFIQEKNIQENNIQE